MNLLFILFMLVVCAVNAQAECKVVETDEKMEVICDDGENKTDPSFATATPKTIRNINDIKSVERNAVETSLIKISRITVVEVKYNNLSDALSDLNSKLRIYESTAKGFSKEDDYFISMTKDTITSYEETLQGFESEILLNMNIPKSGSLARTAIDYYLTTWK